MRRWVTPRTPKSSDHFAKEHTSMSHLAESREVCPALTLRVAAALVLAAWMCPAVGAAGAAGAFASRPNGTAAWAEPPASVPPEPGATDPNLPKSQPSESKPPEVKSPVIKPPTVPGPNDVLHVAAQKDLPRATYKLFGEEFDCELCLEPVSREIGMGARTEFPEGTAMIFVHPAPTNLSYWMKDCLIDMDMVMVDRDGFICALHEATREPLRRREETLETYQNRLRRYLSIRRAQYVIEFPSGTIARLKPALGHRVDIDWKALAARAK